VIGQDTVLTDRRLSLAACIEAGYGETPLDFAKQLTKFRDRFENFAHLSGT
jgi:hypothetical protein